MSSSPISPKPRWSTPADLVAQLRRLWDQGTILAARLDGAALFPLTLTLRAPTARDMAEQFDGVRQWIKALEAANGYQLVWREVNHRQLGRNNVPAQAVVASESDAFRMLGCQGAVRRFDQMAAATLAEFPSLRQWLVLHPMTVLANEAGWQRILMILAWFRAHPRPGMYLRQLDIGGVDTKFIENNRALLIELLDQVLPVEAIDTAASGARQFESRYGLLNKPVQIRFRILDARHFIAGLSDLAVPVAQFAELRPAVRRVVITENQVNGLAFPDLESSIVVFGGGYGIERLADVAWLREKEVVYWGDIDTHGFAILDRLRASLPQARSILMDVQTLDAHRDLWGHEEKDKRFIGQLTRLTDDERRLFEALRDDDFGERIRMEQERLGFAWVSAATARLT